MKNNNNLNGHLVNLDKSGSKKYELTNIVFSGIWDHVSKIKIMFAVIYAVGQ